MSKSKKDSAIDHESDVNSVDQDSQKNEAPEIVDDQDIIDDDDCNNDVEIAIEKGDVEAFFKAVFDDGFDYHSYFPDFSKAIDLRHLDFVREVVSRAAEHIVDWEDLINNCLDIGEIDLAEWIMTTWSSEKLSPVEFSVQDFAGRCVDNGWHDFIHKIVENFGEHPNSIFSIFISEDFCDVDRILNLINHTSDINYLIEYGEAAQRLLNNDKVLSDKPVITEIEKTKDIRAFYQEVSDRVRERLIATAPTTENAGKLFAYFIEKRHFAGLKFLIKRNFVDAITLNNNLLNFLLEGEDEVFDLCLKSGADINVQYENNDTMLNMVAKYGDSNRISFLLDRGADIDFQNINGCTALMRSIQKKNAQSAILLIERGCDILLTDVKGRSPLDMAKICELHEVVEKIEITMKNK